MGLLTSDSTVLRHRLFLEWLALLILGCLLAVWSQHAGLTGRMDTRLLDSATALARPDVSEDIMIVAIDDTSLAEVGAWPWSRATHANLVDQLSGAGAKQIIYDVLFLEQTDPQADGRLAEAISNAGNVVLPHTFGATPDTLSDISPVYPVVDFATAARAVGHVAAEPDTDGVLRRFELQMQGADGVTYNQMMLAALMSASEDSGGKLSVPPKSGEGWPITPFSPTGSFTQVSASEVLQGRVPSNILSGKIVIVGAIAQGMGDRYSVPVGDATLMTGVETQANLLNSLMAEQHIIEAGGFWVVLAACIAALMQFVTFWRVTPQASFLMTVVLMITVLAGAFMMVPLANLWLAPGTALLVLAISYPLWNWRRLVSVSSFLEVEAQKLLDLEENEVTSGGFDIIARQVTRMRMLVRGVRDNLQFLKQVIETVPDPIIVLGEDGRTELWNENAALLFQDWDFTEYPHFSELFISNRISIDHEANEITTADNRTFLLARGRLDSKDENSQAEVIALREITQMRQQEGERQQTLEFLSHDMRTPQVAIIGLTKRAAETIDPQERLERIRNQAQRTLKLAEDFVQLARLEEASLVFEETDLVSLVQEACDRTYVMCRERKVSVDQALIDDMVLAQVEPSMIARLLDNLLGNAIKFSPAGSSVTVSVADHDADTVILRVADQGPGLPVERREDPFARFGAHDEKAGPSAGLGLTFVQRAVEKHHGHIKVVSDPESGTEFEMQFPKRQPAGQ